MVQKYAGFTISFCCLATLLTVALTIIPAQAGPYGDSAHAHATAGVQRTGVPIPPYCIGNCVHCHEQHASIAGAEPSPTGGSPSPYALFADFNPANLTNYLQSDNFCFYCHAGSGSLQSGGITNEDYATTFGSSTTGSTTGIFEAFNLDTYHNLYDISVFSRNNFSYFTSATNPCVACHNPHRAKRNCSEPDNPALAAISRPTDHENLWGDDTTERMDSYDYQPPIVSLTGTYEPGGTITEDSSLTPDYNAFCGDCHNSTYSNIWSTPLGRNLHLIDWRNSSTGDKHGQNPATDTSSGRDIQDPYETSYSAQANYTLSCLDCHEAHGSPNSFLIRRAVNGKPPNLPIVFYATPPETVTTIWTAKGLNTTVDPAVRALCISCHITNNKAIHHDEDDAPYDKPSGLCDDCHGDTAGANKIICEQCHFHGSEVHIPADESKSGVAETRRTF